MPERTEFFAVALAAIIALLIVAFAVIAGASAPRRDEQAVQEPTCSEWTDGCIVCSRNPQGLACSTPGIACVRQAPRCLKP
ncbi:hypothetical protein [Microvirga guangxiensis]|uniref:Uncharacterized protein n=1 Tax=Microvirga guangxiensis TaxID=549386 RepID=A0A1G5LAA8_9HYPH|nr:hypothetical protein [Microvirga guangxiensis]SCZ09847.1 hypothetical protein SAMN02927923_04082 [Microvirga guangxiensis]